MTKPRVAIIFAAGINREHEAKAAIEQAGGLAEFLWLSDLSASSSLSDYQMVVMPGGFSFGDNLGSGTVLAAELSKRLGDAMNRFAESHKPIIGICNGFQTLIKLGLLPGVAEGTPERSATLTHNQSGRFECRWVKLNVAANTNCKFLDCSMQIECPVAHAEGRFVTANPEATRKIEEGGFVALRYSDDTWDDHRALLDYPDNPNGSVNNIAAITNRFGNVLGLMPHPENHIHSVQHPNHAHMKHTQPSGRLIFEQAINYAGAF